MKNILVLDNYDSFTYNLVHLLNNIGCRQVEVIRNDRIDLATVSAYDKILLSPGPGIPAEAGLMPELVARFAKEKSILGICLGHQCIAEHFGARLSNMKDVVHGRATLTRVIDETEPLFKGLPDSFLVGRYHSWLVDKQGLPACLSVTAVDEQGDIMALRHREYDLRALQFHPESILTDVGHQIISNWIGH